MHPIKTTQTQKPICIKYILQYKNFFFKILIEYIFDFEEERNNIRKYRRHMH